MIVSMTGFGDATAEKDGTHYSVEIRSLNNRFFKASIKLPENVSGLEPELESAHQVSSSVFTGVDSLGTNFFVLVAGVKAISTQVLGLFHSV